jgi:hypothetical protein
VDEFRARAVDRDQVGLAQRDVAPRGPPAGGCPEVERQGPEQRRRDERAGAREREIEQVPSREGPRDFTLGGVRQHIVDGRVRDEVAHLLLLAARALEEDHEPAGTPRPAQRERHPLDLPGHPLEIGLRKVRFADDEHRGRA